MINPKDIELIGTDQETEFDPELLKEFENGKGDDENE